MNATRFEYPATVEEAVELLSAPGDSAIPIAGGTALAAQRGKGAAVYVDVTRCGLDAVREADGALHLGAAVRIADLNPGTLPDRAEGRLLADAAGGIATRPLRNAITLGGNLVHLCGWADMPVALLALDATVHVSHKGRGAFELPIADLTAHHPKKVLPKGALVTGVTVPLGGRRGAAYGRFRTTVTDYPLVNVGVLLQADGDRIASAAIAVGAVSPRPKRMADAEAALRGKALTEESYAAAAALVGEQATVAPNFRMSQDVRRRILVPVVRRAIAAAAERARNGGLS